MIRLGAWFLILLSQQLELPAPYHVLVAAIPIYVMVSFMAAGVLVRQLTYAGVSLTILLLLASVTYWAGLKNWAMYTGASAVFFVLWVILFRWRYAHKSN